MNKKKIIIAVSVAVLLLGATAAHVIAGASFDWGDLAPVGSNPVPGAGEANWIAWTDGSIYDVNSPPYEILTEDNTNCELGANLGYSEFDYTDPEMEWWIQVENFMDPPAHPPSPDKVFMIFGGLGPIYSGTLWNASYSWINTESFTYHGTTPISTTSGPACPVMYDPVVNLANHTAQVKFIGEPNTYYHLYRSRNASGAFNGASNGRYFHLASVMTNTWGFGTYTDNEVDYIWYIAVKADPITNLPIGCHSEPVSPTAVEVIDFQAVYDAVQPQVQLSWNTVSETNLLGFNLYRSEGLDGPQIQLNSDLIPASQSGNPDGDAYGPLTDTGLEPGNTYYYWLEVIHLDGTPSAVIQSNPVIVPAAVILFYLPLIQR